MDFRPDINALRALAVVAVMLYHFKLPGVTGGFSGVDIFFVISGFLMTGIIVGGMERGNFSLWRFYASRARRLLPALIVLCFALLLAGWFWLPPTDYKELGRHAATSLIFISNFIFKNESGYFDSMSQDKWLLHTWSLSVEWQFYLIYPLLLIGLKRIAAQATTKYVIWSLAAMTIAFAAFSIAYTPKDPAFAFFLLPTRLWEMSLGGLVYMLTANSKVIPYSRTLLASGLAMILGSIVFFGEDTSWPGAAALIPALGCALVLGARAKTPTLLTQGPVATLGLWSYSIYLWHWPVVVALRHFDLSHSLMWDMAGIALSVALGGLSYHCVEYPLRHKQSGSPSHLRLQRTVLAGAFLCVALSGLIADRNDGFETRAQNSVLQIERDIGLARDLKPQPCASDRFVFDTGPCDVATTHPDYILWGDSHASSVFTALAAAAGDQRDGHTYQATCPPIPDAFLKSKKFSFMCPDFTRKALARIEDLPSTVPLIVAFRMSVYTEGYNENPDKPVGLTLIDSEGNNDAASPAEFAERLTDTLCDLADDGRPVYVMQPTPEFGIDVPREISRDIMFEGKADDITLPLSDYYTRQRAVIDTLKTAQARCGIRVLDPTPYLCSDGVCHGSINGLPLYSDDNHIGVHGAKMLVPMFRQIFAAPL